MKRSLAIVALVVLWAPSTLAKRDSDEESDHSSEYANSSANKCPSGTAKTSSYVSCKAVVQFALGGEGVALPGAFCQRSECYTFWTGLSSSVMEKCMSGYSVSGTTVSDVSGMKTCFTKGGGLAISAPPAAPPPPATVGTPDATSTKTTAPVSSSGEKTDSSTSGPQPVPSAEGGEAAPATATGSSTTSKPSTHKSSTSTSSGATDEQGGDEDGADAGSGDTSGVRTTRIVKKQRTTSSGAVVEELVIEEEDDASTTNSTTGGAKRSKSKGSGSQAESSPSGDARERDGAGSYSMWLLAAGPVGGVVLVIAAFLFLRRRNSSAAQAKKLDAPTDDGEYFPTLESNRSLSASISILGASAVSGRTLPSARLAFWDDEIINAVRIPYEKLEIGALLSRGGYGEVHRGMYRGEPIAIKSLLPERRKDMRQIEKFLAEVKLMAVLEHEHIVQFVGVAWDSLNELCVVSEFMPGGDLRSLMAHYEANEDVHPKGFNANKTKMAMHIAHALTYMHSLQPVVLHRDLKSRNILLDAELNAKLTDFGISRERADSTMTIGVGSSLWMAPEVMTGGRYDDTADVFSFGVVLSELDTQSLPYAHALEPGTGRKLPDTVVVQMMTTGRISVQFTRETESRLAQLGRQCVALDPHDRPRAAEVQHRIHQLWRNPGDSL